MKVVDYKMLSSENQKTLSERVNYWITGGYQPYGSPFAGVDTSSCGSSFDYSRDEFYFCQAVVKYKDKE